MTKEQKRIKDLEWLENYNKTKGRLRYLKLQIKKGCISYGEIAELQSLAKYIDKDDVELLEWAGVKEN